MSAAPLIVGINARLVGGQAGGIEQFIAGVAAGLSRLDGPERYLFLTDAAHEEWLKPHLSGPCASLPQSASAPLAPTGLLKRLMPAGIKDALKRLRPVRLAPSGGALEAAGAEVIHFPFQDGFVTRLPSLYQCHDLQHRYYPDFFSAQELRWRDGVFAAMAAQAAVVVSMTRYGKGDLVRHMGLAPEKVAVVPGGSILSSYRGGVASEVAASLEAKGLPERFLLYPAQTWPHKNHAGLARALGLLRREGLEVTVVCTGRQNEHFKALQAQVRQAGAEGLLCFPGYLSAAELKALYSRALGMVFPSLFEGWGLPVTEAFESGLPVACADATALPEQVGDAALLFDPRDPAAMAAAIRRLWSDPAERGRLAALGRARGSHLTCERTARILRAWYRRLAGRVLDAADQALVRESLEERGSF